MDEAPPAVDESGPEQSPNDGGQDETTPSKGGSTLQFLASLLFLSVVVVVAVLWFMTMLSPPWYAPPEADDASASDTAQQAEFALVENLQKIRESGASWKLRISDEAVNAWLAIRLVKWLAHEGHPPWPEYLGLPQVHTTPSGMVIAIELVPDNGARRVLGLQLAPAITDQTMHLDIVGGLIGRLPVPSPPGSLLELVREAASDGDEASILAVDYLIDGADFPSEVELVDGRIVRLDAITLEEGAFVLEARTLPRR
tara:strand:+ start:554 stop:1321 length:768 start_codon:yes stop_codon:yes gene_type:complete